MLYLEIYRATLLHAWDLSTEKKLLSKNMGAD